MNCCLIFDIGKTNKKAFVFDKDYSIVYEKSEQLPETTDEDGDPCEDVHLLAQWVRTSFEEVCQLPDFQIKAVNFSGYGASFVYLNEKGEIIAPLYNYLKPYPENLQNQFYEKYGGEAEFARRTASPVLGSLNSGMQLYRLKYEQPDVFQKIKYALHLPQWIAFLISDLGFRISEERSPKSEIPNPKSELTSIGCHTNLWDFQKNDYHEWVKNEGLVDKFPPLQSEIPNPKSEIGTGLHDSSAALIPYLASFSEPFVLLSTGTWSISLNPFNDEPLTADELKQDCLCYLTREGKPVKASRLFAGHEHEEAVKRIGAEYGVEIGLISKTGQENVPGFENPGYVEAYLDFLKKLVEKQVRSTNLVMTPDIRYIFVDGGFSKNEIFMTLLAEAFQGVKVFASEVAQASALGAALAIHEVWNKKPLPSNLIALKNYTAP